LKKMFPSLKYRWLIISLIIFLPLLFLITQTKPTALDSLHADLLARMEKTTSFEEFTKLLFQYEVTADCVTTAYTLKNPEAKDVPLCTPTLTSFSFDDYLKHAKNHSSAKDTKRIHKLLANYNTKTLSKKDRLTYSLLDDSLATSTALSQYPFYENLIGATTGVQANLPVTLGEYPLRTKEDIDIYLELLSQIPSYFDDVIAYEKHRKELGYASPSFVIDDAKNGTEKILTGLRDNNNCFQETFESRIRKIKGLSKKEIAAYEEKNLSAIKRYVIPSYEKMLIYLRNELPTKNSDKPSIPDKQSFGICNLPNGKSYYEILAKCNTGSDKTIEEMISVTDATLANTTGTVLDTALTNQDAYFYYCEHPLETFYETPQAILENLSLFIREKYPPLSSLPNYEIKTVPESLSDCVSPAFYMIPAIDDYQNNTIYINEKQTNADNGNLFPTLAHEGFPGHLYQTIYFNESKPSDIRQLLTYLGYVEGWATYVEIDSLNFLDYPLEGDALRKLYQAEIIINLALCARIDMGVNYEGWTLADTRTFFEEQGYNSYYAQDVYAYVTEAPATYLSYFIGYLEILEIKDAYQRQQMENYSEKEFHKRFLDVGPADFATVKNYVLEK